MSGPVPSGSNGRVSFAWVAGVLLTLLFLIGGALLGDMRSDLTEQQRRTNDQGAVQARQGAEITGLQAQLNRIESKLDRALDRP